MFWGKKKESKPKLAAKPATKASPVAPGISLAFDQAPDVEPAHDACQPGKAGTGGYILSPGEGIRSRASIKVQPGDKLRVETSVYAAADPTNGEPLSYYAGVLIYDANGQILTWWALKPPVSKADGVVTVRDDFIAPAGSVAARFGACGAWATQGTISDGKVGLRSASVRLL